MTSRVVSSWLAFALGLALVASLIAWLLLGGPIAGQGGTKSESNMEENTPKGPSVPIVPEGDEPTLPVVESAPPLDRGARPRREDEPRRSLRVHIVEEANPSRGVPKARVNGWHIRRVLPGHGKPPSDNLPSAVEKTDAEGRATVPRITREAIYLQVSAPGFAMARRTIPAADEAETQVEVALARGAVVAGRVLRADGTPAVGAEVRGMQPEQWGWIEESHETVTDGFGAFRLSGYFPSLVSLRATFRDGDGVWEAESKALAGSLDAEVRVPEDPKRRRVRLLVKGPDGRPVPMARWDAEDGLSIPYGRASSHGFLESGVADLPADPDVQWVTIAYPRGEDGKPLPWATTVVGPLETRAGDLEVTMPRSRSITGTVRDDRGNPMPDVTVFAKPLIPVGGSERPVSKGWLMSGTDRNGKFEIEGVPPGKVEVSPFKQNWKFDGFEKWRDEGVSNLTTPAGPIDFSGTKQRLIDGWVRHADGTPAPEAAVYVLGGNDEKEGWTRVLVGRDGSFSEPYYHFRLIRLRAGLSPSGPEDMAASEVSRRPGVWPVVFTVPASRSLLVHVPEWPASVPGAARLVNGPYSRGKWAWILDGTARFDGIDSRAPLSCYCGPLPDGRIAFSRDLSAAGPEATVPLVPSRSIRGRARGFPADASSQRVWADTSEFEATGRVEADGTFLVRGVPPGPCRVCVVFTRGEASWAGFARDAGSTDPVEVELRRMDEAELEALTTPRPPP